MRWVRVLSMRVVGLVAMLALLVSGCSSRSPAPARNYQPGGDLCARVDTAGLAAALGKLLVSRPEAATDGGLVKKRTCDFQFGGPATRIPVEVSIQLAADGGSVAGYYQGLRGVAQHDGQLTPVPGLGQDAYRYTNGIGPHLVTYDRNLYLTYAVVTGALPPGGIPPGIDAAEVTSARATLANLAR